MGVVAHDAQTQLIGRSPNSFGSLTWALTRGDGGFERVLTTTFGASLWYMPLVDSEQFFDGFGFAQYKDRFGWKTIALDEHEALHPPKKPLLPYIETLNDKLPQKWDRGKNAFVADDDWLLWQLDGGTDKGAQVTGLQGQPSGGTGK
jgi:hypothetical protein